MQKNKPLVSIIMNCYNGEKFLKTSIRSVINQSYKNWELIFWDNFSNDKSENIFRKFKDKRLKFFKGKKFVKLYNARNLAIKKASGDFICFLDTDDYYKKNYLKEFVKKISVEKCSIVCSKYLIKNYKKKDLYINNNKDFPNILSTQSLLNKYVIGVLAIMIKKKILKDFKFNKNYEVIGDFDLFIKLSTIYKIHYINKPLAVYRVHGDNFSAKKLNIYINELKNWVLVFNKKNKNKYDLNRLKTFVMKLKIKSHIKKFFLNTNYL